MTNAFPIQEQLVHLEEGLGLDVTANDTALRANLDRAELTTGRVLTVYRYDSTWETQTFSFTGAGDHQERHPDGDELALVLDGVCDVILDTDDGEHAVRLRAGQACVIPRGTWHRGAIQEPATILFITPTPSHTQHRQLAN
jgi:uncharacterized cupin superfamily protein